MSVNEIKELFSSLRASIAHNDPPLYALAEIAEIIVIDLHRIADALEQRNENKV